MNNPGIDLAIWKQLKRKWAELDESGHKVEIEFNLILTGDAEERTIAIDVVQKIDNKIVLETVQREAGEAYEILGIAGLSIERLVEIYKEKLKVLYKQIQNANTFLTVTMTPSSSLSGEVKACLDDRNKNQKSSVQVNYQHYYLLNALRDKMIEIVGDAWSQVRAVYWQDTLEFYFEY